MNENYDAIIVGARVAGSISATLLAQQGHRVLLLDRAHFPSDTLSTHFFRAPSLRAFQRIGSLDEVLATAPHLVTDYNVVDGIVFPEPVTEPDDFPFYMCVRRITLDDILIQRAKREAGIDLHERAKVDGLLREGEQIVGVRWNENGNTHEARARVVIGADGIHSFVAREVQPQVEREEPVNRAMYYAYYRGIEPKDSPAAEFHFRGNHLAYVFPCDGGLTLTAISVPIAEFRNFKRDPQGQLFAELQAMSDLAPRLGKAEREGPVRGTGSIPGYLRIPYGSGWALVGDAAMVMDPWSGQGIDQASTHAVFLAEQLHAYLSNALEWETALKKYHELRNEFSEKTFVRTCTYGRDLTPMTKQALVRRGLV
ncbi:MAG TPA: NAD(P)/FAD-dependent oxidoreductase [Anaerolineales bacterium]|nr:NAD(P)/FAD-dependent oxidoreductase [Anaerolineales bacterium]